MNCPKCNNIIKDNTNFCGKCGYKFNNKLNIIKKNKKLILIILAILILLSISLLVTNYIFKNNISFDKSYEDYNLEYVSNTKIKLGLIIENEDNIDKITINTTCGTTNKDNKEITWDLKECSGKETLEVSLDNKKIKKELKVINEYIETPILKEKIELTEEEKKNIELINNKEYEELDTFNIENENASLEVHGSGNLSSTIINTHEDTKISSKEGFINKLYTLHTSGNMTDANLTIKYTDEELTKYNLEEDNLSIYYYNVNDNKYEIVDSKVNKETKTVEATLNHFSNYLVGDKSKVKETETTDVLFVLDNSWSMYTEEQYEKYTGKKWNSLDKIKGNDKDGLRFSLTSKLAEKFINKNYNVGIAEFRLDYSLATTIGASKEEINNKLNDMNGKFITDTAGTDIANAIKHGIKDINRNADNKYVVILTDGEDTTYNLNLQNILETAKNANVKVCSISFGEGSNNRKLKELAQATGCDAFDTSNADGLEASFNRIETEVNNDTIDIDGDGTIDGLLIADSDFVANKNGFSFANYSSNKNEGHCYGMAMFAELYYTNNLPKKLNEREVKGNKVYYASLNYDFFNNHKNLYEYKLESNALKNVFGYDYFNEELPKDFRKLDGDTLLYTESFKKELEDTGLFDIYIKETKGTKEEKINRWGVDFKERETFTFNEDKMQTSYSIKTRDKDLLNAINNLFFKQLNDTRISSSMNLRLSLSSYFDVEPIDLNGKNAFIGLLSYRLNNKDVPVLVGDIQDGSPHAVNATRLVEDIDNPNIYHIGVYDNNYPGEERYLDIECKADYCVTRPNKYYNINNGPIRITPSLEYDLEQLK